MENTEAVGRYVPKRSGVSGSTYRLAGGGDSEHEPLLEKLRRVLGCWEGAVSICEMRRLSLAVEVKSRNVTVGSRE